MREKLYKDISVFFEIPENELLQNGISLRYIMEKSKHAVNSIDIMEGFADVLQSNDLDDKVDIPVFTLEDSLEEIINELVGQLEKEPVS